MTDSGRQLIDADRFAQFTGVEIVEMGDGRAVTRLEIKDHHRNGLGVVQGGALFTLADVAFAAASNSRGQVAVALNVGITFAKAATTGTLTAEATEESRGPKVGSYRIHVRDESGELLVIFQGLAYVKRQTTAEAVSHIRSK